LGQILNLCKSEWLCWSQ